MPTRKFAPSDDVLGGYETLRIRTMRELFGVLAAGNPRVVGFRERFLAGGVVSEAEAARFVRSPVTRYIPTIEFEGLGIVDWRHPAKFVEQGYDFDSRSNTVTLDITPPGTQRVFSEECPYDECVDDHLVSNLRLPDSTGLPHQVDAWPHSILEWLSSLAEDLAGYYYWDAADAAWFVLTGKTPDISTCSVSAGLGSFDLSSDRGRVLIKADIAHWLPVDVVAKVIRQAQKAVIKQADGGLGSRGNRKGRSNERNLTLVEFVSRATDATGKLPTWPRLMEEWNSQYPEWAFPTYNAMNRNYGRTAREIRECVWPPHTQPVPRGMFIIRDEFGRDAATRREFKV